MGCKGSHSDSNPKETGRTTMGYTEGPSRLRFLQIMGNKFRRYKSKAEQDKGLQL